MNHKGLLYVWCLWLFSGIGQVMIAQPTFSTGMAISNLESFPNLIVDTVGYSFSIHVINTDPNKNLEMPVSIFMSVDGNPGKKLVSDIYPPYPIAPGDSFPIAISDHVFDNESFALGGGGLTHDIIVWPMKMGATQLDSAAGTVFFIPTDASTSDHLGISSDNFPTSIVFGESFTIDFHVINNDPEKWLYEPISIWSTDSISGTTKLASNVFPELPVAPGDSFLISVPGYEFDPLLFMGGGGLTHDIIVWPMKQYDPGIDSMVVQTHFIMEAAFALDNPQVSGLPPVVDAFANYNITLSPINMGSSINTQSIEYWVQLNDLNPVLLGTHNVTIVPGNGVSMAFPNFHVGSLFNIAPTDSNFLNNLHDLSFWVLETGLNNSLKNATWVVEGNAPPNIKPGTLTVKPTTNPGKFLVQIPPGSDHTTLSIYSISRQRLYSVHYGPSDGRSLEDLNLRHLPPGLYLYHFSRADKKVWGKLLISR